MMWAIDIQLQRDRGSEKERDRPYRPYTLTGGYMNLGALETGAIHESIALFTYSEERAIQSEPIKDRGL